MRQVALISQGRSLVSRSFAPSSISPPPANYLVGRDDKGRWVAVETHGRGGGIFADRAAAIRYAQFETERRPRAVWLTPKPLRLL